MQSIYDHKLFEELKKSPEWQTLFTSDYNFKNSNIPTLAGGLDHISKTKKYFTFHDIGCNGRDNSFRIGDQPLYVVCFSDNAFFGTPYHLYTEEDALRPSLALDEEEFVKLYNTGKYRFVTNTSRNYGVEEETLDEIMSAALTVLYPDNNLV